MWESTDAGAHWSSIGDTLPTQVIGAIGWSSANGGTLIAGSGDNANGRYSPTDGDVPLRVWLREHSPGDATS